MVVLHARVLAEHVLVLVYQIVMIPVKTLVVRDVMTGVLAVVAINVQAHVALLIVLGVVVVHVLVANGGVQALCVGGLVMGHATQVVLDVGQLVAVIVLDGVRVRAGEVVGMAARAAVETFALGPVGALV